jgi:hypothetical protein
MKFWGFRVPLCAPVRTYLVLLALTTVYLSSDTIRLICFHPLLFTSYEAKLTTLIVKFFSASQNKFPTSKGITDYE